MTKGDCGLLKIEIMSHAAVASQDLETVESL